MPDLGSILLLNLAAVITAMTLMWLLSLLLHDASVVDPFWGAGFVLIAWLTWSRSESANPRYLLIVWMVTVWGARLSLFLLWRNWGQPEDRRYCKMRDSHGRRFCWVSLFTVFLLQAVILWFVALPVQVAATTAMTTSSGLLDALGVLIWTAGIVFEAAADWQLARFKANPRNVGRVMDRGLWRYSRHPNYFGDFCVWWGIFLVAAAGGAWWTIASPIVMSFLLLKVSGVSLLERTIADRRPEYAAYIARTNAFIPGWPKSERLSSNASDA